jgi:hypothetical protein
MEDDHDNSISPDILADAQAVADCVAKRQPVPPELARRVRERAARIRQEIFNKHGVQDIGVPAIRELRGELPES